MHFGRIPYSQLNKIDWSLPDFNFSEAKSKTEKLKLYLGAPAWRVKAWHGKIYPQKLKSQDYLKYYSQYSNFLELNSVFYRLPHPQDMEKLTQSVPASFKFSPKVFQGISHFQGWKDQRLVKLFSEAIKELGDNLGLTIVQLHENFAFTESNWANIQSFLDKWPDQLPLAIEFRHRSWFSNEQVWSILASRNIQSVVTDTAGRRDVITSKVLGDNYLLRFVGNDLHTSDFERLEQWLQIFNNHGTRQIKNLYLGIHQPEEVTVPETITIIINSLISYPNLQLQGDLQRYSPQQPQQGQLL